MLNLNGKTILITGGCGFIGSNFLEYLFKYYFDIVVINIDKWGIGHRKMTPYLLGNNNIYKEIPYDLCSLEASSHFFLSGYLNKMKFDYIFHFAAESHVDRSINSPDNFIYNNVIGMVRLLEYIRVNQPQSKLINISTDEVFGHLGIDDEPFTENSKFNPRSPYSASKASADLIANSYVETYGLDIVTTHCCNNFGPHQADEKFIPTIIRSILSNKKIPVYGTGENVREWIHVDDHNKSILEIAEIGVSGVSYNIGSGVEKTNLDMIYDIGSILDMSLKTMKLISFVEDRKGHDFRYAIQSNNYERNFELTPHTDALTETVKFYAGKYDSPDK